MGSAFKRAAPGNPEGEQQFRGQHHRGYARGIGRALFVRAEGWGAADVGPAPCVSGAEGGGPGDEIPGE